MPKQPGRTRRGLPSPKSGVRRELGPKRRSRNLQQSFLCASYNLVVMVKSRRDSTRVSLHQRLTLAAWRHEQNMAGVGAHTRHFTYCRTPTPDTYCRHPVVLSPLTWPVPPSAAALAEKPPQAGPRTHASHAPAPPPGVAVTIVAPPENARSKERNGTKT